MMRDVRLKIAKILFRTAVLVSTLSILGSCSPRKEPAGTKDGRGDGRPVVYTTFYPTLYFVDRIAGDAVEVVCPVPEGEDPVFWQPDVDVISRYQEADLIVLNGAGFAKWVGKATLPTERIVDSARGFKDSFIINEKAVTHAHGPLGKQHSHAGLDGHTWLDPRNAKEQVAAILAALEKRLPSRLATLRKNAASLQSDLDQLDARLREISGLSGARKPLLASHPAYNYIARRYGWNLRNLGLDPREVPAAKSIASIGKILQEHPARTLIWEAEPRPETARILEEKFGIRSIVFNPCELLSAADEAAGRDYLEIMKRNLRALESAFGAAG